VQTIDTDDWRRPGPTTAQRRADVLVGLGATGLALLSLVFAVSMGVYRTSPDRGWAERIGWTVLAVLPLVWRRSRPEAALLVISVAFIGGQVREAAEMTLTSAALCAAIYALGAWGRDRAVSRRLRIGVTAAMFAWLFVAFWINLVDKPAEVLGGGIGPLPPGLASVLYGVMLNVLIFGFSYVTGDTAWIAARRRHQLEVQAEQLRQAQAAAEEQAVFAERIRIARELHDVVAHHVSVMGVQAAAGRRVLDKDPDLARTALAAVEQSARTAVDELRRMLGALRRPGHQGSPEEVPAPAGLDRLEALVTGVQDTGLRTRYAVFGDPVPLPESVSQAAYRIAQEAVTNTLKHAGAGTVDVRVRYLSDEVEVDITDDGRGSGPGPGSGMGLIGMRERVAVHDGTLEAGPRTEGGFRVRARLPFARAGAR
jgi:signal transduction histidine kinase